MYKAVIFDLDGTLVNSVESIAFTCNACLAEVGLSPRSTEEYESYTGDGTEALVKKATYASGDLLGVHVDQVLNRYIEMFEKYCTYNVTVYEGIVETLSQLKESKIKLAVLTNKKHERAVTVAEHLFGKNLFDIIIGQRENYPVKPNPLGALSIAEQLECKPEECIYVGDTEIDIKTGKSANMLTVGVLWGFRSKEEIEKENPHVIIQKPNELCGLIQK
jgi:phosphoglycolate phosphatase